MKRPLILAAVVALAISLLALGVGLRDDAPSTHAQDAAVATAAPAATATATAAPVATVTPTTTSTTATTTTTAGCTATTLGESRTVTGTTTDTALARDCDTLLRLRDKLPQPTEDNWLNWSRDLALTSTNADGAITQNWDGVTVGTDANGNKRVTALRLTGEQAPYYFRGVVAELASLDALVALHLDVYETPTTPETVLAPETSRPVCNQTTLGEPREKAGTTVLTDLAKDCDTLLAIEPKLEGTLNWDPTLALTSTTAAGIIVQNWDGVTVGTDANGNKRVTALRLRNKSLRGIIPTQIGDLSALTSLDLQDNELGGVIPTQIGNLARLTGLRLDAYHGSAGRNHLSGTIPTQLGNLSSLETFQLHDRDGTMRGGIPPQLGNLSNLKSLDMRHGGRLGGSIPPQLGKLANLEELRLVGLGLTGTIPPELGDLTKLKVIRLRGNSKLEGAVPWGTLPADLKTFHLDGTKLCVPAGFALPTTASVLPNPLPVCRTAN